MTDGGIITRQKLLPLTAHRSNLAMFVPTSLIRRKKRPPTSRKRTKRRKVSTTASTSTSDESTVVASSSSIQETAVATRTIGEKYVLSDRIGEGRFGSVYRAKSLTGDEKDIPLAVKSIKTKMEGEEAKKCGVPLEMLRELGVLSWLRRSGADDHVIALRDIVFEADVCFVVTEYAPYDLAKVLSYCGSSPLSMAQVKDLTKQLFSGLFALHRRWILHRDIKVQNVLMTREGVLKICDFGSSRRYGRLGVANDAGDTPYDLSTSSFSSSPSFTTTTHTRRATPLTPNMVSGHYRAPELLLGMTQYDAGVDVWAAGCVMAELMSRKVLFPGTSEIEQMRLIHGVLGTPDATTWPEYDALMSKFRFRDAPRKSRLRVLFPSNGYDPLSVHSDAFDVTALDDLGYDLFETALTYDPRKRIRTSDALDHLWFSAHPSPERLDMRRIDRLRAAHEKRTAARQVTRERTRASDSAALSAAVARANQIARTAGLT